MLAGIIRQKKHLIIIIAVASGFFFVYSYLSFFYYSQNAVGQLVFNAPDETANYYFAENFAEHGQFKFNDALNAVAQDLIAPRSMRVLNGYTLPAGFIGLPFLAGLGAKLLGNSIIFFVMALAAALGIVFFYLLMKELFGDSVAIISALFLAINPAWWYYAARGLMPNALFLSLFIITGYFLATMLKNPQRWRYVCFGLFLALMLMVRTSEVTWIGPLFLLVIAYGYKKIHWPNLILSAVVFSAAFCPVFFFNLQNYHSIFSFGYAVDLHLAGKNIIGQGLSLFEKIFLPFGFHPRAALINLYDYTFKLFPVWTIFCLSGLLFFIINFVIKRRRPEGWYLAAYLAVAAYLIIYYGSWAFNDNPDPFAKTIGNSYVRYWLPLYVFILPMLASLFGWLFSKSKAVLHLMIIGLFLVFGLFSYQAVFWGKDEGLVFVRQHLNEYAEIRRAVGLKINDGAVIIADRLDKVFFPQYRVIFQLLQPADFLRVKKLVESGQPVYYFYFSRNSEQLADFNERYYHQYGLEIGPSLLDLTEQSLYPVLLKNSL